ncbi:hypothetical protein ARALYDRAFT_900621 [Arabidopsis lyrata subsp. lyrata]|uniref:Uncharacterized protein n=1 Tax=Arabidopsis lyrata subsp. lyrata TaxID=81972 RepID=D7LCL9_ARALL|nr:hypothetical protein ARALYDRAFT_900621 [Arabidopsis lyrata subsp. lyrata]
MSQAIMSFDVRSEKFHLVKRPQTAPVSNLASYEGKLAVLFSGISDCRITLWVLEDVVKHEWSEKLYVLPPLDGVNYYHFYPFCVADGVVYSHFETSDVVLESTSSSSPRVKRRRKKISDDRSTNSDLLPTDLIMEILKRLPVETLFRFCVWKNWASIIRGRYFMKMFLAESTSRPARLFFGFKHERVKPL